MVGLFWCVLHVLSLLTFAIMHACCACRNKTHRVHASHPLIPRLKREELKGLVPAAQCWPHRRLGEESAAVPLALCPFSPQLLRSGACRVHTHPPTYLLTSIPSEATHIMSSPLAHSPSAALSASALSQ